MAQPEKKPAGTKHPGGRPTDYRPEYCERVVEMGGEGLLPVSMAARIGVTKFTLHEWAKVHPEFSIAFDLARGKCEAWHMERASQTAHGERPGNAPMTKFILSAAFGYRETTGVEHSGSIETPRPLDPAAASAAAKESEEAGEV